MNLTELFKVITNSAKITKCVCDDLDVICKNTDKKQHFVLKPVTLASSGNQLLLDYHKNALGHDQFVAKTC